MFLMGGPGPLLPGCYERGMHSVEAVKCHVPPIAAVSIVDVPIGCLGCCSP